MLLLLLSAVVLADEGESVRTAGMAGTGVANWSDTQVLQRSSAAMVLSQGYAMQADGDWVGRDWGAQLSVVDTRTSQLGVGVAGRRGAVTQVPDPLPGWVQKGEVPSDRVRDNRVSLGAGVGFIERPVLDGNQTRMVRRLGVGLGGYVERSASELTGGTTNAWSVDASVAGLPLPSLAVSGVVHSVIGVGDAPLWAEAGVWWTPAPWVGVGTDVAWDRRLGAVPIAARAGATFEWQDTLSGSLGYGFEGGNHRVATGAGISAQSVRFSYAFSMDIAGPSGVAGWVHTAGVRVEL